MNHRNSTSKNKESLSNNKTVATHPQKRLARVNKLGICFIIIVI